MPITNAAFRLGLVSMTWKTIAKAGEVEDMINQVQFLPL